MGAAPFIFEMITRTAPILMGAAPSFSFFSGGCFFFMAIKP